ncbi:hypothetical protein Q0M94_28255 (plasmid) [Deinococcus radiomollis]|uniref:hypothetical protein n=1 Tax=Deinococcus radiomollis TaxID=468916 RepID=UPI003892B323
MPLNIPTLPQGQPTSGSLTAFEYRLANSAAFTSVTATLSAAAVQGATTLAVTALTGPIPAGAVLHFPLGVDAVLTAAAAAAATTLAVLPLSGPIANAAAASYDGFIIIPVLGEIQLQFAETSVAYQAFTANGGNVWDYAVKVAMNGTLQIRTATPENDPTITALVDAGLASGGAALILFRYRRPNGNWYYGAATIAANLMDPVRAISETSFTGKTTGQVYRQAPL